jgi:hypothetical protein
MNYTKEQVIDMLKNNIVTVTFTKVNGEERVMNCTLLSEYMPKDLGVSKTLLQEEANSNKNSISVWDVDLNAWRSFRVDSVKNILTEE